MIFLRHLKIYRFKRKKKKKNSIHLCTYMLLLLILDYTKEQRILSQEKQRKQQQCLTLMKRSGLKIIPLKSNDIKKWIYAIIIIMHKN